MDRAKLREAFLKFSQSQKESQPGVKRVRFNLEPEPQESEEEETEEPLLQNEPMTAAVASVLKKDREINLLEAESTETLLTPSREHLGLKDAIHEELSEGLESRMAVKS